MTLRRRLAKTLNPHSRGRSALVTVEELSEDEWAPLKAKMEAEMAKHVREHERQAREHRAMKVTLTEFLLARIAEDERLVGPGDDRPDHGENGLAWSLEGLDGVSWRIRSECEAKRRIIHAYLEAEAMHGYGFAAGLAVAVKILAAVYADHPDFDPAWRP